MDFTLWEIKREEVCFGGVESAGGHGLSIIFNHVFLSVESQYIKLVFNTEAEGMAR